MIQNTDEFAKLQREYQQKNQENVQDEQRRLREAGIAYYRSKLNGVEVTIKALSDEYRVSWWKLRKLIRGTQPLGSKGE